MVHVQNFGAQLLSLLNIEVFFQAFDEFHSFARKVVLTSHESEPFKLLVISEIALLGCRHHWTYQNSLSVYFVPLLALQF